jgi:CBS domain-containing protein
VNDVQTLTVEQVMTPAPVCLDEDCNLAGALAFLVREHYQAAPILDGCGKLTGIVTRATLLAWLARLADGGSGLSLQELLDRKLGPAIDRCPVRCAPGTRLKDASRLLVREHVPAMLVVRDERLVGIVTLRDVVRAMAFGDEPVPATASPDVLKQCSGPRA